MATRRRAVAHPITVPPRPEIPPRTRTTVPSPRPTQRTTRTIREIQLNESAADQPREILFGRTTQGLKLLYANSFLNGTVLYLVAAIGEGPVRSITPRIDESAMVLQSGSAINPNGALYTWGAVKAYVYDGGQAAGTQEIASGLSGASFDPSFNTTGAAWTNLAYVVLVLTWNQSLSSLPKITFDVEGYRDLYDPRSSTRGYSENTALVIRELMTNTRWGMQIAAANIDDATFSEAANDCAVPLFPPQPGTAPGVSVIATAGNLSGLYWYTYTNVHANGMESLESPLAGWVNPASQQVSVTLPAGDANTAQRYVYRSGNADYPNRKRVGVVAGNAAATFTDNVAIATWNVAPTAPKAGPLVTSRFQIGINISRQSTAEDWLETLRAHCLGVLTNEGGKYQLRINKALPAGYAPQIFSEYGNWANNNEKPNIEPGSIRWGRKKRSELFNEVEVKFTDAQNKYAPGSIVKSRPAVVAGTETARRATYSLAGLIDSSIAGRVATNLLNLAWDDTWFEWEADRSALKTLPWDVVKLSGAGLVNQLVRVRSVTAKGEGFVIRGTEYDAASYSDAIVTTDAPIAAGTSGFNAQGSLAPPTALTLTEQVDQPQAGVFLPKLVVNFTPNTGPAYGGTKVTLQVAGGNEVVAGTYYAGPAIVPAHDAAGKQVTVRAYTIDFRTGAAGTTPIAVTYQMYDPNTPEPIGWIYTSTVNGSSVATWDKPPARSTAQFPAAQWSASNATTWVPASINDGILTTAALAFNSAVQGWVMLDAQTATAFREIEIYALDTSNLPSFTVQWSNDNATWNPVAYYDEQSVDVSPAKSVSILSAAVGAHRYWRLFKSDAWAYSGRFAEIRFRTYTGTYPYAVGYRLSGNTANFQNVTHSRDITQEPSLTDSPIPLSEFTYAWKNVDAVTQQLLSGGSSTRLDVQTISPTNALSDSRELMQVSGFGATGTGVPVWLPVGNSSATAAAHNVDVSPGNANVLTMSGATAAWDIGGINGGYAGRILTLTNSTSFAGVLLHEDPNTAATNRFSLPENLSYTLPAGQSITLNYDGVAARWKRIEKLSAGVETIGKLTTGYGTLNLKGAANGYSGINFPDQSRIFMVSSQYQGIYNSAGAWQWYWNNGVLEAGSVPWSLVINKPGVNVSDGTYGGVKITGVKAGWPGIWFSDAGTAGYFLWSSTQQGAYDTASNWKWRFTNGVLDTGTVPGAQVSSPRASWVNNAPVTAQELGWKNFGNNHTVVDNSAQSYRPNNADPDVEWQGTYPTLMGFNGTNTYGVRVDRARYADNLKAGAIATTPAAGDNSTKVATTAFVLANGGGMERVSSMNPNTNAWSGNSSSPNRPPGFIVNRGYGYTTTNTTIVNITGKGALRFLSAGMATSATGYLTVVVDGTAVLNDAPVYFYNQWDPGFAHCFVGAIVSAYDSTNAAYDTSAVPSDYGITFKTSLAVYVRSATANTYHYVQYAYVLY